MLSTYQYMKIAAENIEDVRAAALARPRQNQHPPMSELKHLHVYRDGTAAIVPPHTPFTPNVQSFAPVYNYKTITRLARRLSQNERGG